MKWLANVRIDLKDESPVNGIQTATAYKQAQELHCSTNELQKAT